MRLGWGRGRARRRVAEHNTCSPIGLWRPFPLVGAALALVLLGLPAQTVTAGTFNSWSVRTGHELVQRGETLASASCATASHCVAIGTFVTNAGIRAAISVTLSRGVLSAAYPTLPSPSAANLIPYFGGISCASATSCVAVGYFAAPPSNSGAASTAAGQEGFALTLAHGVWRAAVLPLPSSVASDAAMVLRGVSCATASSCVAVGDDLPATGRQPLILTEVGGGWSATTSPLPVNAATRAHANLNAVDCDAVATGAPLSCNAVGVYSTSAGSQQGLLLSGDGGSWTPSSAPLPPRGDETDALNAISCPGPSSCTAVGTFDADGEPEGLVLQLVDGNWQASAGPDPGVADGIYGLSCPSTSSCVAVGTYLDSSIDQQGLILRFTGARWKMSTSAPPSGGVTDPGPGLGTTLNSVSCAARQCVAVGTYFGGFNDQVAVLLETAPG